MKRLLAFVLLLLCFTSSAFADKEEWKDKNYDFTKANRIYVGFYYSADNNAISKNKTIDIFFEKTQKAVDELKKQGYEIFAGGNIKDILKETKGIDIDALEKENPQKAQEEYDGYIAQNADIGVIIDILAYGVGTQYHKGYYINMPTTETSHVYTPYGSATVTTHKDQQQYISGGYYPTAYCVMQVRAYSLPEDKLVWEMVDNRLKINSDPLSASSPEDIYRRIVNNWIPKFKKTFNRK